MKVLHVLYSGLGGHGNVFFSTVDADKENVNQYEAIFFGVEEVREGYKEKAASRHILWHYVKKEPGKYKKSYKEIVSIIKKSQPDIIFLHSSAYIFPALKAVIGRRKKIKVIVRETQPYHLKTKLELIGLSFALLFANKVVFLNNEYSDIIKKRFRSIFSKKRTAVVPNGVDLGLYKPSAREALPYIKLGMQSRLAETKDHTTLIDAFNILLKNRRFEKPLRLYLAGDGNCRTALEKQVDGLGIGDSVFFTGMLEEKELPPFINSLDIYVHATLGEMMSTAIIQVMACNVPIIASDVFGVNNMIHNNENGLLVPVQDVEKLANAINALILNDQKAKEIAFTAFKFATENYSNEKMFNSYSEIFNS